MLLNQRDVVDVNFTFPDGQVLPHPVIVLSIQAVTYVEKTFIGIPISHSDLHNENGFSFPLYNSDFDTALLHKDSHARLHLISVIPISAILNKRILRKMREESFNRMFDEILNTVFGCV